MLDLMNEIDENLSENGYTCNICKAKMFEKSKLRRHLLVHSGEKAFECFICEKRFSLEFNMRIHLKVHMGDEEYKDYIDQKKRS